MHFILFIFLSRILTPQTIGWRTPPPGPRHARLHLNIYPIASADFWLGLVVVSIDETAAT